MSKTPDILLTALRQYKRNCGENFIAGFEYEETIRVLKIKEKEIAELKVHCLTLWLALHGLREYSESMGFPMSKADEALRQTPTQSLIEHDKKVVNETIEKCKPYVIHHQECVDMMMDGLGCLCGLDEIINLKEGEHE